MEEDCRAISKSLLTTGSIQKRIIKFAIPIFIGNLFQQLYNAVDSLIVGNEIGSNALAAVSGSGSLLFMAIGFFNGISIGAGVVIARHIGAKNPVKTEEAVHSTVALGLLFSVLMTILGVLFTPQLLTLMRTPINAFEESVTYVRIYFAGSLGFVMYNTFVGILQAAGNSKSPLYYLIISSGINVVLDIVLIKFLGFGVGAAAFATAVSQLISAILCMINLMRTKEAYGLKPSRIRFDKKQTVEIIKFGLPTGLQNSIMAFSNVVIQSYINDFGEFATAGIGAYIKIEGFVFIPITSFSMAITTFVSQNIGAGEYERAKKGVTFTMLVTVISAETLGMLLFIFAEPLIALFDPTPEVVAFGAGRARVVCPFFICCSFTHFMAAVMRGVGKPVLPMVVFLTCWCVVRVAILQIAAEVIGKSIQTTYWVYPITWILSTVVLFISYRRIKFRN